MTTTPSTTFKNIIYLKSDPIAHILMRPDMYVGSKEFHLSNELVWHQGCLIKKTLSLSPALLRLFLEILSNAVDHCQRDENKKMTTIKVTVAPHECSVWNDGEAIAIDKNNNEAIYNHTLIFGHLLSGSNYDDTEQRWTSGRNGLGAKLTNVFSNSFQVEGVDPEVGLKFVQRWTDHMRRTTGPRVTRTTATKGYTKVAWQTDYSQFGVEALSKDMIDLYSRFVIDVAMITGLSVYLNDEKIVFFHQQPHQLNRLVKYAKLLLLDVSRPTGGGKEEILKCEDARSKVVIMPNTDYEQVSFVNGVYTKHGGKHVDAWVDAVCRPILRKLVLKGKGGNCSVKDIKNFFRFIIVTQAPNPVFDGQEKHTLVSPSVTATPITAAQVAKIMKWSIGSRLKSLQDAKEITKAIKTAKKQPKMFIEGYDKANNAGGRLSKDCTLIVCEGLSAKTFTVAGIEHGLFGKKGRDWFGIYPLRGKLLNVRNASPTTIAENAVVTNLIKILGLDYGHPDKLNHMNYGRMCIITDADVDGIHIEGLLLNLLDSLFPRLLSRERHFVVSMKTPIIKTLSPQGKETYYFDERTYARALPTLARGTVVKYFKGLGTNKPNEVKHVFGVKMLRYHRDDDSSAAFERAFAQTKSDERRTWLGAYTPPLPTSTSHHHHHHRTLDDLKSTVNDYSLTTFLTEELVKFSYEDCRRSLPSVVDGLKESQRKVIYAAKKRKLYAELKVAQFGGYVAEHTNYHHGEQNLFDTIIKMAQDFPGSNNVPLLSQEGMFGTRLEGGKDAASPRYICTMMTEACRKLFPCEDDDLLTRKTDDGDLVEPVYYVPIVPLLLVNGCVGIGTGWATHIPLHTLEQVKANAIRWIRGEPLEDMRPGVHGFKGEVERLSANKYVTRGVAKRVSPDKVLVTELPVGLWNDKFKTWCNNNKEILSVRDNSTPTEVNYELHMISGFDEKKLSKGLETIVATDNMVVFDKHGSLCKVTVQAIYDMWGEVRRDMYAQRKRARLKELAEKIDKTRQRIAFISLVRTRQLVLTDPEPILRERMTKHKIYDDSLLTLTVRSLTREQLADQEKKLKVLTNEAEQLKATSVETLWLNDIDKL